MSSETGIALKKGADGWRGIIGESFSIESASLLALAIAVELTKNPKEGAILIAHDGRFYSDDTARAIAEKLVSVGFDIAYAGQIPTPVSTFLVKENNYKGALLITASHNPFYWNGIKLKVAPGMPPTKEIEASIELLRKSPINLSISKKGTLVELSFSAILDAYISKLISSIGETIFHSIQKKKIKVALDGLHGVSTSVFETFLKKLGCEVVKLDKTVDPLFGGIIPDPMNEKSRQRIVSYMKNHAVDIGFVTDGDGDRLCVLNEVGEFVWPHDILALLLKQFHELGSSDGGVVMTTPTGSIVHRMAKLLNKPTFEVSVGFKYATPFLRKGDAVLAGGAVGEFGYRDYGFDRDPLVGSVYLLYMMSQSNQVLSEIVNELHKKLGASYYRQWTLSSKDLATHDMKGFGEKVLETAGLRHRISKITQIDGIKFHLGDIAWVLFRHATTENGIRIYAEAECKNDLQCLEAALI